MEGQAIINGLANLGIPGLMLAFFIWYVNKLATDHKEERKEWSTTNAGHVDKFVNVIEKNTDALISMEKTVERAECRFSRLQKAAET